MREVGHGKGLVSWWWGLFRTSQGCEARFAHRRHMTPTCNVTMEPQGGKRHMSPVTCHSPVDTLECLGSIGSLNCP